MTKMICLECGHEFDAEVSSECPICKNHNQETLLKTIDTNSYKMHDLGVCKSEDLKKEVKNFLNNKTHSSAYIKLCSRQLERMGYMHLSLVLDRIAIRKMEAETTLMEAFGVKEDVRLNLNNVLIRAQEDIEFADKIAKLSKNRQEEEIHDLMHEMAKTEAENLSAILGVLNRYLIESSEQTK